MFRVMPALEAYAVANVATQNLMGGNPIQVIWATSTPLPAQECTVD